MTFVRISSQNSAWRSFSYPAAGVSGARQGDWRALKPGSADRKAWPMLSHHPASGNGDGAGELTDKHDHREEGDSTQNQE